MNEVIKKLNNILKLIKELKEIMVYEDTFWLDLIKIEMKFEHCKETVEITKKIFKKTLFLIHS